MQSVFFLEWGLFCSQWCDSPRSRRSYSCKYSHDIAKYLESKAHDIYLPAPPAPPADKLPLLSGSLRGLSDEQRTSCLSDWYSLEAPFVKFTQHDRDPSASSTSQSLRSDTICPLYEAKKSRPSWDPSSSKTPQCPYGFRCRFLGAHIHKATAEEESYAGTGLRLPWTTNVAESQDEEQWRGALDEMNYVSPETVRTLRKRQYPLPRTKAVIAKLTQEDREWQKTGEDARGPLLLDTGKPPPEKRAAPVAAEDDMDALMNGGGHASEAVKGDHTDAAIARADDAAASQSASFIDRARIRRSEKRKLDWYHGELYLAPLTTTGNLPFRRVCSTFGSDIHCGEMGLAGSYLSGNKSEWSLVRRWEGEKTFGIQLCGSKPDLLVPTAEAMANEFGPSGGLDFVDINCGCPIDMVFNHGGGSALLDHPRKLGRIVRGMDSVLGDIPVTVKLRTGVTDKKTSHSRIMPRLQTDWGVGAVTMHGRSRKQRYSKRADWDYIRECADELRSSVRAWNEDSSTADEDAMQPIPVYGNGDVYSQQEYYENLEKTGVDGEMLARGALIKPWLFTEIKERKDWDISSRERLDIARQFASYGLTHWGSDTQGVNKTRRFLCEAISFWHRYVPLGLLEVLPPSMNDRPPPYKGRDDLETLLASDNVADWVKISEMFLGKAPADFNYVPKHKSNSYSDESAEQQG